MKVIYHIGLHSTDEDRALRCLLRNDSQLQQKGIVVAQPGRFRPVLREAMIQLKGQPATEEMQDHILEEITEIDHPQQVLFSNDSFLCVPKRAIQEGTLYPLVAERAPWIRNLFPGQPAEFALGLRNPATLIPALHARFAAEESFEGYLARIDPEALSWADMVERLHAAMPDARLTIWCNEDSPLIWLDILEALSGLPDASQLDGNYDFIASLMTEDGFSRLQAYLDGHPASGREHWRRIISAFLDKFARPEAVEEEFDLPGWTQQRVADLSARYEADIERIAGMDGVDFLSP
ncbi:hypothetical protein [Aliiruegeria lutimaris]|uniref:Uncharacterized protein n=1 Tax=Aliiruegeria lutimaris TaxID=571298 RepID=A0A1G8WND7_9RHOB|nr:hypothetical protein [Aliiruegeria lutimaris]SDJ79617.1 hypothetical protein SAMN04488026_102443 [Aliiruegeria lutimaris]